MKKIVAIAFVLLLSSNIWAQRHEIGIMIGHPNLIADIGKTNYIQPFPASLNPEKISYSLGLLYRFNLNPRQSLRLNLNYNKVSFDDAMAREDYRITRDKRGENNLIEGSILFEYYLFDINDIIEFDHSPYIFAGLGAFMYKDRLYTISHESSTNPDGTIHTPTSATDFITNVYYDEEFKSGFAIPFGVGYKVKFNYNWLVSAEIGVRATNIDRLDYSYSTPEQYSKVYDASLLSTPYDITAEMANRENDIIRSNQTGNLKSTDWYVISGVSLTYTFGRPPCFCD